MKVSAFLCVLLLAAFIASPGSEDAVSEAVAALQRGDLSSAEQTLQAQLRVTPNDASALGVLGVVLDQEKKYTEADKIYRRAVAVSPASAGLFNNFGNHLVAMGKSGEARDVFLKALALNPGEVNARVQLARIALQRKSPAEAARYLDQLPRAADTDAHVSFSLGVALASVRQYERAEAFFEQAVKAAPDNFEALYDLGLAASHAGHRERAREVLQQALAEQPGNVDVLYDLAAVNAELDHKDTALELLAKAARLAPERADVQFLLAHTSADLGYFGDAAQAWSRYMKLKPDDDAGRREYGFAETALGEDKNSGMADLEWFVRKHPNDAVGHYELGMAKGPGNPEEALKELDRALALKPDLAAAHVARGILRYRRGQSAAALPDFEFAAQHEPLNPTVLDRLGETYLALGRSADALPVLRKAAKLAPRDSTILLHLGRALTASGQTEEAKAVFARFRELGPNRSALPHPAGLVDFLSLPPDEQFARYRAGVERTVQRDPSNAEAQVRYLELMLQDGKEEEAADTARKILTLKPSAALLANAAEALLASEKYSLANDFLQQAVTLAGGSPDLRLDQAIASFHLVNAQAALEEMGRIPQTGRNGDYYLADFLMLEAVGRGRDASAALKQALQAKPMHIELYRQAALLLKKEKRTSDAKHLLDQGGRMLPNDPELPGLRATID